MDKIPDGFVLVPVTPPEAFWAQFDAADRQPLRETWAKLVAGSAIYGRGHSDDINNALRGAGQYWQMLTALIETEGAVSAVGASLTQRAVALMFALGELQGNCDKIRAFLQQVREPPKGPAPDKPAGA